MQVITDPTQDAFIHTAHMVEGGRTVSYEFLTTAHHTCWMWPKGTLSTCPYGPNKQEFVICWKWDNGTLTVHMGRK